MKKMVSMSSTTMMSSMIDAHLRRGSGGRMWRDVVAAWTLAVVLTGALLLAVPEPDDHGPIAHFQHFVSVPMHAHRKAPDVEGPSNDEECSERDYMNERC
jgi:hypothetical protein